MVGAGTWTTRQTYVELLDRPIDMREIRHVLQVCRSKKKTPAGNGIGKEFYKAKWSTIKADLCAVLNQMYMEKTITT
jgi:hypothetical protein